MKKTPKNFFIGNAEVIANNSKLTAKSRQSIYIARAKNTIDAYESDWKDFCDWCEYHNVSSFPALPETIINYINDLADNAKANTVSRRISALTENFDAAGIKDNPCRFPIVKNALRGIKRMKGTMQHGKMPILFDDIKEMMNCLEGNELQQARDKAILLIGFYGAMRRSELAGLDVEDLRFTRLGLLITLRKSKTDQYDQGQQIGIPFVADKEVCGVTALRQWLQLSGITTGPVFRGFTRSHTIRKTRISDKSIALIVKQYAGLVGMDPKDYGAHSLRHGFATSAAQHHVEERQIMHQTRHKSQAIVRRYIDEADSLIDNPIFKITGDK
jgi:integrase